MEQCLALVDYDALAPDEISFRKGDIINVTAKGGAAGFWEGVVALPRPDNNSRRSGSGSSSNSAGHKKVRSSSYSPSHLSSVAGLDEGRTDDDAEASRPPHRGLFASCFVSSNLRSVTGLFFRNKAICLYSYKAESSKEEKTPKTPATSTTAMVMSSSPSSGPDEAEMSFVKGDVITVLRPSSSPGWWYGVNESALQRRLQALTAAAASSSLPLPLLSASSSLFASAKGGADGGDDDDGGSSSSSGGDGRATGRVRSLKRAAKVPAETWRQRLPLQLAAAVAAPLSGHSSSSINNIHNNATNTIHTGHDDDAGRPRLFPVNFVSSDVAQAAFPFEGRHAHELSCAAGDVILVHRRWNDGWWEGTLRGQRGIFPSNYTVPNQCTTRPLFFCQRCKTVYDDTKTANLAAFLNAVDAADAAQAKASSTISGGGGSGGTRRGFADGNGTDNTPIASPNLWRECAACARNATVTDSMLAALAAHDAGTLQGPLDLFAFVQTGISGVDERNNKQKKSRRRKEPSLDNTAEKKTRARGGQPATVGAEVGGASGDTENSNTNIHNNLDGSSNPSLLNAKDLADLAAGRVKI